MVIFKKQVAIILIFSLFLSLTPNFLYNGNGEALAGCENDAQCVEHCDAPGYINCTAKCSKGECLCTNCEMPIRCDWGANFEFEHKSCLPEEEAGEWGCGKEIPIGEAIYRTSLLADKMEQEFVRGIIENANLMIDKIKGTPGEEGTPGEVGLLDKLDTLSCRDSCEIKCRKYFYAEEWEPLAQPVLCGTLTDDEKEARNECQNCDETNCTEVCNDCPSNASECKERDDCIEIKTKEVDDEEILCEYWPEIGCEPQCKIHYNYIYKGKSVCRWKDDPFDPVTKAYDKVESSQDGLKKDIEGGQPGKFQIDTIEKQLNFSRCELSKCYITAEEYPKVMTGEMTGKHLFTCQSATEMGLLEDDQIECLVIQAFDELDKILKVISKYWPPKHWWEWAPNVLFAKAVMIGVELITSIDWKFVWDGVKVLFKFTSEEGCFPTNYYCCQM